MIHTGTGDVVSLCLTNTIECASADSHSHSHSYRQAAQATQLCKHLYIGTNACCLFVYLHSHWKLGVLLLCECLRCGSYSLDTRASHSSSCMCIIVFIIHVAQKIVSIVGAMVLKLSLVWLSCVVMDFFLDACFTQCLLLSFLCFDTSKLTLCSLIFVRLGAKHTHTLEWRKRIWWAADSFCFTWRASNLHHKGSFWFWFSNK